MTPESRGSQDLLTYLRIFWRWKFLFLAFLILIPLGTWLIERNKPKVYESSTLISVQNSGAAGENAGAPVAPPNIAAVARLVTTTPVAHKAALFLHPVPTKPGSLVDEVTATADPTTDFLTITARDHNPERAAAIASAFASALGGYQSDQAIAQINLQLHALQKQLKSIPVSQQASRATVINQIAELRAQRGSKSAGAQVIEPAVANSSPVGPETTRAVALAFVIALLLGIGAVLLAENSDRRLRSPEDLENLTGMRLLGVIPRSAFEPEHLGDPRDEEAFQMLRAALAYFSVDRPLKSVAIISPLVGDGKTTVSAGLAVASARAGKKVILVDADLRRPQVCPRLGMEAEAGLGEVLSGQKELEEVLVERDVGATDGGQLLVLPGGPPPPNPSALISSQVMRHVLRRLEDRADLVIVDTAAALAVSDSIPLVRSASAIAIIVRMNRSSSAAVRRLQKVIESAEGNPIGVVATGQQATGTNRYYRYRYGDYGDYSQRGRGRLRRLFRRGRKSDASYPRPHVGPVPPAAGLNGAGASTNGASAEHEAEATGTTQSSG